MPGNQGEIQGKFELMGSSSYRVSTVHFTHSNDTAIMNKITHLVISTGVSMFTLVNTR